MPNLIMLVGIPGCGKSTWAKTFFPASRIVSSDQIRKRLAGSLRDAHDKKVKPWDVFYQEIEDGLAHDVDVIADATFLTPEHRRRAYHVAGYTGADIHAVLFKNIWVALDRNKARPDDTRVPDEAMKGMVDLYWDTLTRLPQEDYKTITRIEAFS